MARGLSGSPPTLPPKLFYDDRGARLFEEITRLPEYYPTRTEVGILEAHLPEMARQIGPGVQVVEFGSGSGEKTELLLRALEDPAAYVPVDIAEEQLARVAAALVRSFPGLKVVPLAADYTRPFRLPDLGARRGGEAGTGTETDDDAPRPLLFFPGSTIGNFEPADAGSFLRRAGESLGPGSLLLIGVDLVKPREILEPAYNDSRGVTAAFNRNALVHLNRVLATDFRPESFRHRASWNEKASRIEMHLVATEAQVVTLPAGPSSPGSAASGSGSSPSRPDSAASGSGPTASDPRLRLALEEGDHIVTEHSYKYTLERFEQLTDEAGWITRETWTDPRKWFAVRFLERKEAAHDRD